MSGHSKWAKVKQYKGGIDAKRSSVYTKMARFITVAARSGGDPDMNFALRMAVDRAKAVSVPKDVIDRAIARGSGASADATAIEEAVYEGIGPGKVGIIVRALTDNKTRAVNDIKQIFTRNGGTIGTPNSIAWNFDKLGVIYINNEKIAGKNFEDIELALIEADAKDIKKEDTHVIVYTSIADLHKVTLAVQALGIEVEQAKIEYVPKDRKEITPEEEATLMKLLEALDDNDDVDEVFHNAA
jgi:YebC/PmpR family DNA-binding regulatory protein